MISSGSKSKQNNKNLFKYKWLDFIKWPERRHWLIIFIAAHLNGLSLELCVTGLGMYETPLFLAHEEESGGRSVPTTPLQVAAPGKWQRLAERSQEWFPVVTMNAGQPVPELPVLSQALRAGPEGVCAPQWRCSQRVPQLTPRSTRPSPCPWSPPPPAACPPPPSPAPATTPTRSSQRQSLRGKAPLVWFTSTADMFIVTQGQLRQRFVVQDNLSLHPKPVVFCSSSPWG